MEIGRKSRSYFEADEMKTKKQIRKDLIRKREYPNECFCKMENRDYKNDIPTGETVTTFHPAYGNLGPFNIFTCSRCGGKYTDAPAIA